MSTLPDEILKEILAPPLQISDVEFSHTGRARESPFGRKARNSSSLLVVSKQWMRVATPHLYEAVIIRTLAYAIKCNKAFGRFVKKLRMEGGFGKAPAQFIASAPNIRELFVALDLWSNDNPSGLCSVFPVLNVHRLIINHQDHTIKNAKASRLWECLSTCIPKWLNLVILEYHTTFGMTSLRKDKYMELATILKASPSVKHMVLDCVPRYELCELAGVPSLDNISVESIQPPYEGSYPLPRKIVQVRTKYPDNPAPEVLPIPSVVGRFNPLMNVPKPTAEFIWDLIFSFATHSYYVEKPPSVKPFTALNLSPRRAPFNRTARRLSLVSKSFREIVRRHMYSTVQVESDENFATFCNVIKYNDTLALLRKNRSGGARDDATVVVADKRTLYKQM
ncbi:hypothetical protein BD410DRAFT_893158 [Rickenella mellea]|uniref:Uncharacterized protein n=1 Tax=Rickenella mellea TaxID=50990 RepID=A0A4R5XFR4_9AGAM|nr:hypothetical protein BD410DRAFT_893158 [Rickenella mellea]